MRVDGEQSYGPACTELWWVMRDIGPNRWGRSDWRRLHNQTQWGVPVTSAVQVTKTSHCPKMPHSRLLWNLSPRKLHILCSYRVFQWWVWVCASHSCCVAFKALTLFCKVTRFLTLYIAGSYSLITICLVMHTVILPTVCMAEEWTLLYLWHIQCNFCCCK
jgi:hypothetical protein